jgi:hypothetical protein
MAYKKELTEQTRKVNRFKSRYPRGGYFWCYKCDRDMVAECQKCRTCGAPPIRKTMKHAEIKR